MMLLVSQGVEVSSPLGYPRALLFGSHASTKGSVALPATAAAFAAPAPPLPQMEMQSQSRRSGRLHVHTEGELGVQRLRIPGELNGTGDHQPPRGAGAPPVHARKHRGGGPSMLQPAAAPRSLPTPTSHRAVTTKALAIAQATSIAEFCTRLYYA